MREVTIIKFGELWLKSEFVRNQFVKRLAENIRRMLKAEGISFKLIRLRDMLVLETKSSKAFEVIQRVKKKAEWRDIPIVVVTAKDLTDADFEFLRQRVDKIIRKSGLDKVKLVGEVQQLLREHGGSGKEDADR